MEHRNAMTIHFQQWMVPNSRRMEKGSRWACAASIDGRWFQVSSRLSAPYDLARALLEAGIPDGPFDVWDCDAGMLAWPPRLLSEAAKWAITEGAKRSIRQLKWRPLPQFADATSFGGRIDQNGG